MKHDDGTRVQISQCEYGGGYRVGMAVDYVRDGRRVRSTVFERGEGATYMSLHIRIWPNGRREIRHINAPWPEHIREAFLGLLDPASRDDAS
ncbi:MAG: hypothetical protein U9Q03_04580 [Patescibacteria group bacterium]|nr:hypothetical protein [Patescibacteria group bacterium]